MRSNQEKKIESATKKKRQPAPNTPNFGRRNHHHFKLRKQTKQDRNLGRSETLIFVNKEHTNTQTQKHTLRLIPHNHLQQNQEDDHRHRGEHLAEQRTQLPEGNGSGGHYE